MRQKLQNWRRQLNKRKFAVRLVSLLVILGGAGLGVFYAMNNIIASPVIKPSVLIIQDTTGTGTTGSSAAAIKTYLDGTGMFTTTLVTTATWPTAQAAATNYDTVIYSAGGLSSPLDTTEQTWLDSFLNTYYGHLIVEGEAVLGSYVDTTVARPYTSKNTVITSNILKATSFSKYRTTGLSLRASNLVHPVSYGMSTTSTGYTNLTSSWSAHNSSGRVLARWSNRTTPYYVLSAWEGTHQRERLVFIDFDWDNWTSQTEREKLMNNAVKWTSEFCEVKLTSMAPANVPKGTKNVKMGMLTFSTYATAANSNTNTITSITVYNQGTALNSSIKLVRLYQSDNLGNIIGVNPVAQGTVGSDGKAVIAGMSIPVTAGTDKYYVVTYDISDPADESKTLNLRLDPTFSTREKGRVKIYGGTLSGNTTILNITKPDIPLYVKGTNLNTGTTARLDWHAVTTWDLVGYNVYRAEDSGSGIGAYSGLNGSVVTNIYYNDAALTEFHRYYYKIRSLDSAGNESLDSDIVEVVPNRPPGMPTGLGVSNLGTGGRLSLSWSPSATPEPNDPFNGNTPDFAGYNLYAATSSSGPFLKINPHLITGTSYVATGLKNGMGYYFKVAAVDRYDDVSTLTDFVSGTPTDTTAPEVVESYPTPAQDYVETTAVIQVKFDDILDVSGNISQLITLEKKNLDNTYTNLSGTVSYDQSTNELLFTPDSTLSSTGNYRVTVKGGETGCTNLSGLKMVQDKQWTFGTLLSPHADFKTNNTLCGYCHSAHSATGPNIIREPTVIDLCFICHDGSGSSYDVKGGRYFNGKENVPMAAGGYDLAMGSTSTHFSDLGSDVFGSPGLKMNIDCNTCHEPHGSSNYRNIRTNINGKPVTLTAVVYGPSYGTKTVSGYEVTSYVNGWEQFCGTCHSEYQVYHSVTTITGEENWRHRTDVPLTGGSTDGRWVVAYPNPGLYTTLPTIGEATGANITNTVLYSGGSLSAGTYNYVVTTVNAVGESVYGNIAQIVNPGSSGKVKLVWDRIPNAYQYRIYRYKGTGDPKSLDISNFNLLATVPDIPVEYLDDGVASPQSVSPPITSDAKVGCITCHIVHGTSAVAENGDPTRLRRYDNDGVCQDCHKK